MLLDWIIIRKQMHIYEDLPTNLRHDVSLDASRTGFVHSLFTRSNTLGRQQRALAALIRAPTIEAAAETAGVGYSTLRRWMREDTEFKAAYQAEMGALLEDASAQSKKSLSTALSVLTQVMEESENPQARIAAARATIEYTLRLNEAADVERRLAALEAGGEEYGS